MRRLFCIILFSLFLSFELGAQFQEEIKILTFQHKFEAKRVQRRFNRAVIYKEIVVSKWSDGEKVIYIEIEDDDYDEYYKRFGLKRMCVPKRHFWEYYEYTLYLMKASDGSVTIDSGLRMDLIL